jgi:hypothetical protein
LLVLRTRGRRHSSSAYLQAYMRSSPNRGTTAETKVPHGWAEALEVPGVGETVLDWVGNVVLGDRAKGQGICRSVW